jgi:hypothetical protein
LLPAVRGAVHRLGDHVVELLDWQVIVRLAAHCRRRYRRACPCPALATVTVPGPPKAIGKGRLSNARRPGGLEPAAAARLTPTGTRA